MQLVFTSCQQAEVDVELVRNDLNHSVGQHICLKYGLLFHYYLVALVWSSRPLEQTHG